MLFKKLFHQMATPDSKEILADDIVISKDLENNRDKIFEIINQTLADCSAKHKFALPGKWQNCENSFGIITSKLEFPMHTDNNIRLRKCKFQINLHPALFTIRLHEYGVEDYKVFNTTGDLKKFINETFQSYVPIKDETIIQGVNTQETIDSFTRALAHVHFGWYVLPKKDEWKSDKMQSDVTLKDKHDASSIKVSLIPHAKMFSISNESGIEHRFSTVGELRAQLLLCRRYQAFLAQK